MPFVLDSSVALAWALPDEQSEKAYRLAERFATDSAVVPILWYWEVTNGLWAACRRSRITSEQIPILLNDISVFPHSSDIAPPFEVTQRAAELAVRHGLTVYDAAYLEIAVRNRIPLATLDERLAAAARKMKIKLL